MPPCGRGHQPTWPAVVIREKQEGLYRYRRWRERGGRADGEYRRGGSTCKGMSCSAGRFLGYLHRVSISSRGVRSSLISVGNLA